MNLPIDVGATAGDNPRNFRRLKTLTTEGNPASLRREAVARMATADLRMLETVLLQVDEGQLPQDAITRLGYSWGPILANPGYACIWPELRTQVGASVRKYIEDTSPPDKRVSCKVDLQALRDATVLHK